MSKCVVELGTIEITAAAEATLARVGVDPSKYLARHRSGDWGDVDEEWTGQNDFCAKFNQQVTSMYQVGAVDAEEVDQDPVELSITTAADRSHTRVYLAAEYERREVDVKQGYAAWAKSYDYEKNPLIAVEEPLVDALLVDLSYTCVLDVGTGTGRHALRLARQGASVTGLDLSREMLAAAQHNASAQGAAIEFLHASIDVPLPVASSRFDLVICALMLCHVPNLRRAVQEFHRVLVQGGYALITDFHPDSVKMGWRTVCAQPGIEYLLPNHPHSRADYLNAIVESGFTTLQVIDAPLSDVPLGYLSDHTVSEYGEKMLCLIVLAQKNQSVEKQHSRCQTFDTASQT